MNSINAVKLLIVILVILISGCEKEELYEQNVKIDTSATKRIKSNVSTVLPGVYKGMYSGLSGKNVLTVCGLKNKFFLASELGEVKKLFEDNTGVSNNIYIEAEGFITIQSKTNGEGYDSVIVITNLLKTDPKLNCN